MPKNPLKRIKAIVYIFFSKQKEQKIVSFPICGEIALKVGDSNYKIINLKERAIYTVLNGSSQKYILEKLLFNHSSKMYEEILNVDKKNKVIKGVFYNGHHPNIAKKHMKLNRDFCNLFFDLITKSEIREVKLKNYVKSLYLDSLEILERNSTKLSEEHINYVKGFILTRYEKIEKEFLDDCLHLTLSHGDIKEDNLIENNNRLLLIDWEFCDFRLPSYDILQFKSRFPNFSSEYFQKLIATLKDKLTEKELNNEGLNKYLEDSCSNYLDVFYLEDIKLRLSQFETRDFAKDFLNYIIIRIQNFEGNVMG
jgi:thiamine kinase-like enzyme